LMNGILSASGQTLKSSHFSTSLIENSRRLSVGQTLKQAIILKMKQGNKTFV
jgi:hypothetical protein